MMNAAAPKRDTPAAVLGTVNKKNLLALPCLKRGPEAGSPPNNELLTIFMVRVRTPAHVCFNRRFFCKRPETLDTIDADFSIDELFTIIDYQMTSFYRRGHY